MLWQLYWLSDDAACFTARKLELTWKDRNILNWEFSLRQRRDDTKIILSHLALKCKHWRILSGVDPFFQRFFTRAFIRIICRGESRAHKKCILRIILRTFLDLICVHFHKKICGILVRLSLFNESPSLICKYFFDVFKYTKKTQMSQINLG